MKTNMKETIRYAAIATGVASTIAFGNALYSGERNGKFKTLHEVIQLTEEQYHNDFQNKTIDDALKNTLDSDRYQKERWGWFILYEGLLLSAAGSLAAGLKLYEK
jgi:hypothetical protein